MLTWNVFLKVTSAYSVLSDNQRRAEYDKARRIGNWIGASQSTQNSSSQSSRSSKEEEEPGFEHKNIFRSLFGGIFHQSK